MTVLECIRSRRSIRSFTGEHIPDTDIQILLDMAMCAPSAMNRRPWAFIVIHERATLDKIQAQHPYAQMLAKASHAILVCGNGGDAPDGGYWVQDGSAAIENMLLAAHSMSLGAVWLGIYPRTERMSMIRDILDIPAEVAPLGLVALGIPSVTPVAPERFEPVRVHYEKW